MEEIRARAEKHIKAEENLADRLEVERQPFEQRELRLGFPKDKRGKPSTRLKPSHVTILRASLP
ncbi:hypothetical protein CR513_48695, partial [Mucuna pruriens]